MLLGIAKHIIPYLVLGLLLLSISDSDARERRCLTSEGGHFLQVTLDKLNSSWRLKCRDLLSGWERMITLDIKLDDADLKSAAGRYVGNV